MLLHSLSDQCIVLALGTVFLKPGSTSFSRWTLGFNASTQAWSSMRIWIQILDLPLEFCKAQNLLNRAIGVSLPSKISPLTLSFYHRMYARILVEVDLSRPLPQKILVTNKDKNNNNEFDILCILKLKNS